MKKVLSLVLTLALVLSSFSMAFADDAATATAEPTPAGKAGMTLSDVAKSPNKEAIGVVNDLGIVLGTPEGTFLPEKDVTRAEFAAMITRALAIPKSALEGYQQTPFKDMAGYEWANGYIAFCVSKGIMVGDGMGNAMPGRTVTLNEAVTMALRAIGYVDNSAHLKGAWPANFVTKAQELSLYENVAKDSVVANRETAAQLIYNLLPVQKVAVETDGKTVFVVDEKNKPVNLLTAGLNAKDETAAVVTVSDLDNSAINMARYLGQYGVKYSSKTGKNGKTLAFMPDKDSQMLVGRVNKDGDFVTTDDEVTYTVKDTTAAPNLVNAKSSGTASLVPALGLNKEFAVFAEVSGKTIKKVHAINSWVVTDDKKVEDSDLTSIKSAKLFNKKFVKDDNGDIDTKQFVLNGVANLSDIKADHVVYVFETAGSDKQIVRVDVGTETVEGVVKRFESGDANSGTVNTFKIGDKTYKNAEEVFGNVLKDDELVTANNVTAEVKASLDARGNVYTFESKNKADKYALVQKLATGSLKNEAKLLLADGEEKIVEYDLDNQEENLFKEPTAGATLGLVAYGLNSKGVVTEVDKELSTATVNTNAQFLSNSILRDSAGTSYRLDKNVAVFTYKAADPAPATANQKYAVTTIDKVTKNQNTSKALVILKDDNSKVFAVLLHKDDAKEGSKNFAVVNKVVPTDSNGDKVYEIKGYLDGTEMTKLTDGDDTYGLTNTNTRYHKGAKLTAVELFSVSQDKDGKIVNAESLSTADYPVKEINDGAVGKKDKHQTKFDEVVKATSKTVLEFKNGGTTKPVDLAEKVVFYRVNSDNTYEVVSGVNKGDYAKAFELNEEAGYDVVFVVSVADDYSAANDNAIMVDAAAGVAEVTGFDEITVKNTNSKKYVIKSPNGKFVGIKANGDFGTEEDTATKAALEADTTAANTKVFTGTPGTTYKVIEVKTANVTAAVGANKELVATQNGTTMKAGKDKVEITLTGATLKAGSTVDKVLTGGTLSNVSDQHIALTVTVEGTKIVITGSLANGQAAFGTLGGENFTTSIAADDLEPLAYDESTYEVFVLPAGPITESTTITVKSEL